MDGPLTEAPPGGCRHCGLPSRGDPFCCYGCELAHAIRAEAGEEHAHLYATVGFLAVLSMIVMTLSLFLYAEDVFDAGGDREMAWMRAVYRWAAGALTVPVLVLGGWPLARRAAAQARAGRMSMDALIVMGAVAAFAVSVPSVISGEGPVYFESATAAIALATLGRYLEATARARASRSLGPLLELARGTVRSRQADGRVVELAASEIEPGMRVEVGCEQIVPVDLELEDELTEVDLAVLSGESRPVTLRRGQTVPAGAAAVGTAISGRALRAARDSALERLAARARSLAEGRTSALRFADRFARALTPIACALAVAACGYWTRVESLEVGVSSALAVVLAACPCGYAIASPLVHWLALRRAFGRGVLIRGADSLESLAAIRTVAFDKTGTLTEARLSVGGEELSAGTTRREVLSLVRALEEGSTHPVARALHQASDGVAPAALSGRRFVVGRGVQALDGEGHTVELCAGPGGRPTLYRDGALMASFEIRERLRPEAGEALRDLRRLGVSAVVLSGDTGPRVRAVAGALGVEAHAELGPDDKVARLHALGEHAAMVGDGVNDAPALAGRLTGFSFGDAAQLAKGVAQVTLCDQDLRLVPWTIELARSALRRVRWLLVAASGYNLVFLGLAASGRLWPVWAGVSMLGSSLLSLAIAVRQPAALAQPGRSLADTTTLAGAEAAS